MMRARYVQFTSPRMSTTTHTLPWRSTEASAIASSRIGIAIIASTNREITSVDRAAVEAGEQPAQETEREREQRSRAPRHEQRHRAP